MTAESSNTTPTTTAGIIPPIPTWLYWIFLGLCAAIPVVLVSGDVASPWDTILAAINAFLAVMTGTSRPSPPAERAAIAAERAAIKQSTAYRMTAPPKE